MTLADVADDDRGERDTVHVCSGYCAAFEAAHPGHTGLTILSAEVGWVCFQVGDGPECFAETSDLRDAKAYVAAEADRVRVDGDWLDESDVDYLLDVATRSQETSWR